MTHSPPSRTKDRSFSFRSAALLAALVVASVAVIATAREMALGRREVAAADDAANRSDWPEAIRHARAAAEAFVPASPWPERGEQRLRAIGHDAEKRGDAATALLAYGAARAAALATQAPGSGSAHRRVEAEAGLARVAGWDGAGANAGATSKARDTAQSMRSALSRDQMPPSWALAALAASTVALVGGLTWLGLTDGSDRRRGRLVQSVVAAALFAYAAVLLTN